MSFTVKIHDSSLPTWQSDLAAYLPRHYNFLDPHPDPSIQLIDLVESWKGLSPAQATELRFWHLAFRGSLERYIHATLLGNFGDAQLAMHAGEIHNYVARLQCQVIHVDIDRILQDMTKQAERSPRVSELTWLLWDRRVALVNMMRLYHGFVEDVPQIHVYFYSEMLKNGGVQVYAEILTRPPVFTINQSAGTFEFSLPVLDAEKGLYYTCVEESKRKGDCWELKIVTLFRGCKFERTYRFKNDLPVSDPPFAQLRRTTRLTLRSALHQPLTRIRADSGIGLEIEQPTRHKVKKVKSSRKKLREISQNSVRVQGMSDFERAAREAHPEVYEAHHDHLIGKETILGKIYGRGRRPSPQRTQANMVITKDDYEVIQPHLGDVSFRTPRPLVSPRWLRGGHESRRIVNDSDPLPEQPLYPVPEPSHPLPELPRASPTNHYSSDEDDEDSLYRFSPVRIRPGALSSPIRSSTAARERDDLRKLLAPSSAGTMGSHAASSPLRRMRRSSSPPLGLFSPRRMVLRTYDNVQTGTAIRRSPIEFGEHAGKDRSIRKSDIQDDEFWKPRPRVAKKQDSFEFVPVHGPGSSQDTIEITPPCSSASDEDMRG